MKQFLTMRFFYALDDCVWARARFRAFSSAASFRSFIISRIVNERLMTWMMHNMNNMMEIASLVETSRDVGIKLPMMNLSALFRLRCRSLQWTIWSEWPLWKLWPTGSFCSQYLFSCRSCMESQISISFYSFFGILQDIALLCNFGILSFAVVLILSIARYTFQNRHSVYIRYGWKSTYGSDFRDAL